MKLETGNLVRWPLNVRILPGIFYLAVHNQGYRSFIHDMNLHFGPKLALLNFNPLMPKLVHKVFIEWDCFFRAGSFGKARPSTPLVIS